MSKVDQKIIDRIAKLLAMADDASSPNEAAIAARRAESLMRQHQLDAADVLVTSLNGDDVDTVTSDPKSVLYGKKTKMKSQPPLWVGLTATSMHFLFDCGITRRGSGEFQFHGVAGDAQVAAMTFEYLVKTINRLGKEYQGTRGEKSDFRRGCAVEIQRRCKTIKRERDAAAAAELKAAKGDATSPGTQLVVLKQQLVEAAKPGSNKFRSSSVNANHNQGAYHDGRAAGAGVGLNQQISGKKQEAIR